MRRAQMISTSIRTIAVAAVATLAFSLADARPAAAWYSGWDSGWDSGYDDWDHDEDQAWAEEQSREAGRAKRRDELEAKKEKDSAEHDAYFTSIVQASQASLTAPRGVYYRKPGFRSNEAPGEKAQTVIVDTPNGKVPVLYDQGMFWLQRPSDYIVVIPPPGVVVDTLPTAVRALPTKSGTLYYYFGVFFQGAGGKYAVVKPPAGTVVGYLPDGYTQETVDDVVTFKFGGTSYKQVFVAGALAYQVV